MAPDEVRRTALRLPSVTVVTSRDELAGWIAASRVAGQPVTFVVNSGGYLVVGPRESEHVAAAQGDAVLSAGEMTFDAAGMVLAATNQSTDYCPEPGSWVNLAEALDHLAVAHPGGFTSAFEFRRCPSCVAINLGKDLDFTCAVCGQDLPAEWNLDSGDIAGH